MVHDISIYMEIVFLRRLLVHRIATKGNILFASNGNNNNVQ